MDRRKSAYINDVDALHNNTPLDAVLEYYELPPIRSGSQYRMHCVFSENCNESSYGQLTVNVDSKEIYCHSCGVRGNLFTLLHGLEHQKPPTGSRLRGDEFKAAYRKLKDIVGGEAAEKNRQTPSPPIQPSRPVRQERLRNVPLSAVEKTQSLENLFEEFVVDPANMNPGAASYFRERGEWLTPELAEKWGMGYLPRDGRSMFKGWVVYTHRNQQGEVISYSGRDVNYPDKLRKWKSAGAAPDKRPMKHKYVKGFHRGIELFGQMADRLSERAITTSLERIGLGVVEGMNDVIRLDELGIASVGLCSNRATEEQVEKLIRFARHASRGRVWLMLDNDEEGEAGCKDLLWKLHERGLRPVLGWSSKTHEGAFTGMQPEDIRREQWPQIEAHLIASA